MKKIFMVLCFIIMCSFYSCGMAEKMYEDANYESITNERGTIEMYSGGKLIRTVEGKILYSDANSFAMWIELKNGDLVYWQGEAFMDIK